MRHNDSLNARTMCAACGGLACPRITHGVMRSIISALFIAIALCGFTGARAESLDRCPGMNSEHWSQIQKPDERNLLWALLLPRGSARTVAEFLAPKPGECEAWSRNTDGRLAVRVQTPDRGTCSGGSLRVVEFRATQNVWAVIEAVEEICIE